MYNDPDKRYNTILNQHTSNITNNTDSTTRTKTANKQPSSRAEKNILKSVPAHVLTISINHVVCPMHIIELTRSLKQINVSETLRVIPGGCSVEAELLAVCRTLGHKAISIENNGQKELFITRKK